MENRTGVFLFSGLAPETWAIVTSNLDFRSLTSLIHASNKLLRRKLLKMGGVTSLVMHWEHPSIGHSWDYEYVHTLYSIRTINRCTASKIMPLNFFSGLTMLSVASSSYGGVCNSSGCDLLPPSLTHLEWWCRNDSDIWDGSGENSLKNRLPKLRTLAVSLYSSYKILFTSLPLGLESLTVHIVAPAYGTRPFIEWLEDPDHMLPKATQSLFWCDGSTTGHRGTNIGLHHIYSPKLASLTSLSLPSLGLNSSSGDQPVAPLKLTSLRLKSIDPRLIANLPTSVTDLVVLKGHGWSALDVAKLPLQVKQFCTEADRVLRLNTPPSITRATYLASYLVSTANSEFKSCRGLLFLDFPSSRVVESVLKNIPPSVTRLRVKDILFDGSSLPSDLESLDSIQDCKLAFQSVTRPYLLLFRNEKLLSTTIDYGFHLPPSLKRLLLPFPECRSLSNLAHGLLPHTLTELRYVMLCTSDIPNIPVGLVTLNCYQREYSDPINLDILMARCPNLTSLSSGNPSLPGFRDTERLLLLLGPQHFPSPVEGHDPTPSSSFQFSSTSALPTNTLRLPEDAINKYNTMNRLSYPNLSIEGVRYHEPRVCWTTQRIVARKAVFIGSYSIKEPLASIGFENGLVKLDIGGAEMSVEGGESLPSLPPSLTHLVFGRTMARRFATGPSNPFLSKLPSSVTRLGIVLPIKVKAPGDKSEENKPVKPMCMWENFDRWDQILQLDILLQEGEISKELCDYILEQYSKVERVEKKSMHGLKATLPQTKKRTTLTSESAAGSCHVM